MNLRKTKFSLYKGLAFYDFDSESTFFYGSSDTLTEMSQVYFEEDLVVGWISASTPLKTGPFSGDCFTIGSTKEEVLSIQGTPDDHGDTFRYGTAGVEFQNGRVTGWWHIGGSRRLKVKLLPKTESLRQEIFHNWLNERRSSCPTRYARGLQHQITRQHPMNTPASDTMDADSVFSKRSCY